MTYKWRSLWFGFLCIRLVILFMAELPFSKLDIDFSCNGTVDSICSRACFNQRFHQPMMAAWNFLYILVILSVLLMEMFTSHLHSVALKRSSKLNADVENWGKKEVQTTSTDVRGRTVIHLRGHRGIVGFYLLSITLRILVEAFFVYILLFWNLPTLNKDPYDCNGVTCVCGEGRRRETHGGEVYFISLMAS
ncbi:hypothetical protein LDENG_00170270 [Lucifuga dentata]|nr:hypothetical protein LDENG_00170270 [Lucifuga dentata]